MNPRRQPPLTRLDVELPRELIEEIAATAKAQNITVDELWARAIREWLNARVIGGRR
jgi:hypothetical protein